MPMAADEIDRLIREGLPEAEVTIRDLAGDGDHYAAHVVSPAFAGKSRVQQHKMVYEALGRYDEAFLIGAVLLAGAAACALGLRGRMAVR